MSENQNVNQNANQNVSQKDVKDAVAGMLPPSKVPQQSIVEPVVATSAPADPTSQKLDLLLQLLLSREARQAETEENTEKSRRARNAQRELSARTHVEKQLLKQARCRHLKGGKHGPKSGVTDYNVSLHTYINGENVIKCLICGMKWKSNDTQEFLTRGGRQIANHTKTGWVQAQGMLAQSTNTATSSEVPMEARPATQFNGVEVV